MVDFSWSDMVSLYDPRAEKTFVMTLDAAAKAFGEMSAVQKVRADAEATDPLDLGDGQGPRTNLTDADLQELSDLWQAHQASLSRP